MKSKSHADQSQEASAQPDPDAQARMGQLRQLTGDDPQTDSLGSASGPTPSANAAPVRKIGVW